MNDCCNTKDLAVGELAAGENSGHHAGPHRCPANGKRYASVQRKTLLHHVQQPWKNTVTEQAYYFCTDPDCDVVYYGQDDTVFHADELRTTIWQKSGDKRDTICYCFGVTRTLAMRDRNIKDFVMQQTRDSLCSCETSNPSGRCCLKDLPEAQSESTE